MLAVRDHLVERPDPDLLPVVVTFVADPERLAAHRNHLGLRFPVLGDPDRALYGLLGAGRGTRSQVWSPGTIAMYARLIARGRRPTRPRDDTRQLGADAIVDTAGRLRRLWLPSSPDARPTIAELREALDAAR